jgi:hypothetical protein
LPLLEGNKDQPKDGGQFNQDRRDQRQPENFRNLVGELIDGKFNFLSNDPRIMAFQIFDAPKRK